MKSTKLLFILITLVLCVYGIQALNDDQMRSDLVNLVINDPADPVYINYNIRTDDYFATTKERNLFQGNADPVWQLTCQVSSTVNNSNWPSWISVADVPGSRAYRNGNWHPENATERWSGMCLSDEDNVYVRIQGYENEGTDTHTYVSGTDSYYSYDSYDIHYNLSETVTRNTWRNFDNSDSESGDCVDCGAEDDYDFYKAELDVWWDYALPVNPIISLSNATSDGFTITLTDTNDYRITSWNYQISDSIDFSNIVLNGSDISDTSTTVSSLIDNTQYYVRIQGSNEAGTGNYNNIYSLYTQPAPSTYVFPIDLSQDMPRQVTVNWRYEGTGAPSGFNIYQNNTFLESIDWDEDKMYNSRLNQATWSETVYWKAIPYNSSGETETAIEYSFTVMDEPVDSSTVPDAIVYSEVNGVNSAVSGRIDFPTINLNGEDEEPWLDLIFETEVSDFSSEIQITDQPSNPLPQPSRCLMSLKLYLPQGVRTHIILDVGGSSAPNEIVHWNGTDWIDITTSSMSDFGVGSFAFYYTSTGRGVEEFAINNGQGSTLPISLSSFTTSIVQTEGVQIHWTTESESNLLNYNLLRATNASLLNAVRINSNPILAHNNSSEQNYSFTDKEVEGGNTYTYWLESVEIDGVTNLFGPIEAVLEQEENPGDLPQLNLTTELIGNYPNPFNPSTNIMFSLNKDSDVEVKVYNTKGQLVYNFGTHDYLEGNHSLHWNGKNLNGKEVSSGIYFVKMRILESLYTHKMTVMK